MKFQVRMETTADGDYVAFCDDPLAQGLGDTRACALDRLRQALRFQLELCPCSTIDPATIEFDVSG